MKIGQRIYDDLTGPDLTGDFPGILYLMGSPKTNKMKKWLIGSLVGGVIIFAWQFLSWTVLQLHEAEARYTPNQDTLLQQLAAGLKEDGQYMLPTVPPGSSQKAAEEMGKTMHGKPWAMVTYKTAYVSDMVRPMIRGALVSIFLAFCLIYILTRGGTPRPLRIFAGAVALGLLTFLWGPYTQHNWFQTPVPTLHGHLIDSLTAWGLVGIWLGWWLNRR